MSVDEIMTERAPRMCERAELEQVTKTLAPLGGALGKPQPGDWLEEHVELGQTFLQYVGSRPTTATPERNKIYIVPLGEFTDFHRRVIQCVAEFMAAFYGLPVVVQDTVGLDKVKYEATRCRPDIGDQQILSTYLLHKLREHLPADAATYLCLTSSDLWPGKDWNFVFGQADLRARVGVWSLFRFGGKFRTCLKRTLATAVHETGHMFSMQHCTAYNCGMCGCNSLPESDRRPIHFCPQCTAKVAWATGVDLLARARNLRCLCEQWGLQEEAEYYAQSAELLAKKDKAG